TASPPHNRLAFVRRFYPARRPPPLRGDHRMGSSSPRSPGRRAKTRVISGTRITLAAATVPVVVAGFVTAAVPAAAEPPALPEVTPDYQKEAPAQEVEYTDGYYMVQLAEAPVATYEGG